MGKTHSPYYPPTTTRQEEDGIRRSNVNREREREREGGRKGKREREKGRGKEKKGKVGYLSLSLSPSLSLFFFLLPHGGITCAAESEAARSTLALMVSRILLTWPADSSNCPHGEKRLIQLQPSSFLLFPRSSSRILSQQTLPQMAKSSLHTTVCCHIISKLSYNLKYSSKMVCFILLLSINIISS
jgi:hypothetical protein